MKDLSRFTNQGIELPLNTQEQNETNNTNQNSVTPVATILDDLGGFSNDLEPSYTQPVGTSIWSSVISTPPPTLQTVPIKPSFDIKTALNQVLGTNENGETIIDLNNIIKMPTVHVGADNATLKKVAIGAVVTFVVFKILKILKLF